MIHQYVSNGYNIVLDVNSGCVHVVDEMTYRAVPFVEEALAQNAQGIEELTAYVAERLDICAGETAGSDRRDPGVERGRDAVY